MVKPHIGCQSTAAFEAVAKILNQNNRMHEAIRVINKYHAQPCFVWFVTIFYYHAQGGDHVDLIPGGSEMKVNSSNVYDYVRKYADYRLVKAVSKPLEVTSYITRAVLFSVYLP